MFRWVKRYMRFELLAGDQPRVVSIPVRKLGLATGQVVVVRQRLPLYLVLLVMRELANARS